MTKKKLENGRNIPGATLMAEAGEAPGSAVSAMVLS